jgi:hypothetical protein
MFIKEHNTVLVMNIRLPKDYKGGDEELFISTPAGQTFTVIKIPPAIE